MTAPRLSIPDHLKPADGRFGSGPSKVPAAALSALAATGAALLGTSHRQAPVKALVARIRAGLAELFTLPDGYEVVLGNGGSTAFWDAAAFGLVRAPRGPPGLRRVLGQVRRRHARRARSSTTRTSSGPTTAAAPTLTAVPGADVYAWPQNETSTGVALPVRRVPGADPDALMLVDATSAAGAMTVDLAETDAYYFAPQKAFAAEAGLWLAICSPAALGRIDAVRAERWAPPVARPRHRPRQLAASDQTYNTPAIATLWLLAHQVEWLLAAGGLTWAAKRSRRLGPAALRLGRGRRRSPPRSSPIRRCAARWWARSTSPTPSTPTALAATLRANGIVDTEPYRALGPQPAAHRHVPRRRPRRRRGAHRLHRLGRRTALSAPVRGVCSPDRPVPRTYRRAMRQLRLVHRSEDGSLVVETLDADEQFSLPVDAVLRTAVRADLPRPARRPPAGRRAPAPVSATGEAPIGPREIQVRVRAGESPEPSSPRPTA